MIKICDNCIIGLYLDDYNHNITLEELEEAVNSYELKRDTDIANLTFSISVPVKNLKFDEI